MKKQMTLYTSILLDENTNYTLQELGDLCSRNTDLILEMIDEGMLVPTGSSPNQWRFGLREIHRVQTAQRLIRDLQINLAGAALALDLLEELNELRRKVSRRG
ncbi:MAG: chaperone modulator CbpM [Pseudomonadota bacterium]|nr:chaperone modulator CbpM [Pseudomonadota bacterium]